MVKSHSKMLILLNISINSFDKAYLFIENITRKKFCFVIFLIKKKMKSKEIIYNIK
jgi:MinD-like ATPase involved in chromosome partitioning or flagellar assembly